MSPTRSDDIVTRASEMAHDGRATGPGAAESLMEAAGGDRNALVSARDQVAAHLHGNVDDFEATAALQVLNRALSNIPIIDPLDWKVRWGQRFRRP